MAAKRLGIRTLVVAFASALALTSCGSASSGAARGSSAATARPQQAASVLYDQSAALTMAIGADPGRWNCDVAGVDSRDCLAVVDRVWPSVFHIDASGRPQLDRAFVESATQTSQNPQTIVYRINPKAKWSDGTPLTYKDFVYNWQAQSGSAAYQDLGGAAFKPAERRGYGDIASVTGAATDPDVVTVVFSHPYPDWQNLFGAGDPLVPAQVAQRVGFNAGFTDPVADVISAGPYEVQSYIQGRSITLVRNPLYWGQAANLASVTFRFLDKPAQVAPGLRTGEIGAAMLTPALGPTLPADVYSAVKALKGVNLDDRPSAVFEQLELNQATPALADPSLRHALMLAVPRSAMLKQVPGAVDASTQLLDNRFYLPGADGYRDNSGGAYDSVNLTEARQLLLKAGYDSTAGAPLTKGGQPVNLRITSMADSPTLQAQEQLIVSSMAQLGITVTEVDSPNLAATLAQGAFDLAIDTSRAGPFLSENDAAYQTGTAGNVSRASDPGVDALISKADTTSDPQRRSDLGNQLDQALWAGFQSLPLFQLPTMLASQTKYVNLGASASVEGPTSDLDQWGVAASS